MNEVIDIISIFTVGFIIQFLIIIILNLLKKAKIFKNLKYIAISSYVVVIINLTLWPPVMGQPTINWSEISYNLVPFDSIIGSLNHSYSMIGIRNVCGNFILLLPLAMLVEFKNWKRVILVGCCISLSIESLQVILTKYGLIFSRIFDVDDLILNTFGFFVGYLINSAIRVKGRIILDYAQENYTR